jgi:hypothetical protein
MLLSAAQELDRAAGVVGARAVEVRPIWDALYAAWKEVAERRGK